MKRIGFSGVPSSGKSTLARALAANIFGKRIELVPEYARRYINKYGFRSLHDQFRILHKQLDWEDSVPQEKTEAILSEAPIFNGFAYATIDLPKNEYEVMVQNDLFKLMNKLNCPQRYDVVFHLLPTIKPVDDGTRSACQLTDEWREMMDNRIRAVYTIFPPRNFVQINSLSLEERVAECKEHIARLSLLE